MENKKKPGFFRRLLAGILTLLIVAAALLLFLYRDRLSAEGISSLLNPADPVAGGEMFSIETGTDALFLPAGNGLAVVSSSGFQLMDDSGLTVANQIVPLAAPAASAGASGCVFYDVGGTALRVADFDGGITNLDSQSAIISASVNKNGYVATVTEINGYKALVTVYNADLTPVYNWYAGSSYVLAAEVSPDNRQLALLTASAAGGGCTILSLSSETPLAETVYENELFIDLHYTSSGTICLISEERLLFLDTKGGEKGECGFGGLHLNDYSLRGDGFAAVLLGKYRSGNVSTLMCVSESGEIKAELEIQRDVVSLAAGGNRLLAFYSDELALYSPELKQLGSNPDTTGLSAAVLRSRGDCILVSPYSAEIYSFR